jgi:GT2 family glycosyltransferase
MNAPRHASGAATARAVGRRHVVGIATTGRREILTETIRELSRLRPAPTRIVVCPASPADLDEPAALAIFPALQVVRAGRGLPRQRNAILDACEGDHLITFIDDDFFPATDFLAQIERLFAEDPRRNGVTGHVIADGANTPGLSVAAARRCLRDDTRPPVEEILEPYGAYGCNMSFRIAALRRQRLRFDERLPLYGWWEDIDFSRRACPQRGSLVRSHWVRGVHLGAKSGRASGLRLGYSQIANILYLIDKGSVPRGTALRIMWRNVLSNHLRALRPEPWIDRRGRVRGNWLALWDALRGRAQPERILELP